MIWRMNLTTSWIGLLSLSLVVVLGCGGGEEGASTAPDNPENETDGDSTPRVTPTSDSGENSPFEKAPKVATVINPLVIFRTSAGEITVELDAKNAPITVDNFLENYTKRGFYDGTIFHYVDPGNMIVGGGYDAQHELKETRAEIRSEADNSVSNTKGTLAMARSPDFAHSATSQFFFNLQDNTQFDHQSIESAQSYGYCVFGKVTGGMAILEKISSGATKESEISPSLPSEPVIIQSVEVTRE